MRYGIATLDEKFTTESRKNPYYTCWSAILQRCYCKSFLAKNPSYAGCSVAPEWLVYSKFKAWMNTQNFEGKQLDKDIKIAGNLVYGPDACMFVTHEVNNLFHTQSRIRGLYPQGVKHIKRTNRFCASMSKLGKDVHLGYFATPEEAHIVYKRAKNAHIQVVIDRTDCPTVKEAMSRLFL